MTDAIARAVQKTVAISILFVDNIKLVLKFFIEDTVSNNFQNIYF